MYVLGAGGVKGVSEHLEEFRHGLGMLCYRTLNVLRIVFEMYTETRKTDTIVIRTMWYNSPEIIPCYEYTVYIKRMSFH